MNDDRNDPPFAIFVSDVLVVVLLFMMVAAVLAI
jgi:hypothetical protein